MRVDIHGNGIAVTGSILDWIHERLTAALHQHEARLSWVDVRLRDLNGPRGGDDMECEMILHVRRQGIVVIKEQQPDLYEAISIAAARLKNAVRRRLSRKRQRRGGLGEGQIRFVAARWNASAGPRE